MILKTAIKFLIALVLLLGMAVAAYAEGIGSSYTSLGYDDYDTMEEAISIVPIGRADNDLVSAIEPTDSIWKPAWSRVPMTRYWFDSSGQFIERWAGLFSASGGENIGHKVILLISNIIFTIGVWLTRISIELILLAFNTHILVNFGQEAVTIATSIWNGDSGNEGVRNTLLLLVLVLAGFYYIFRLVQAKFTDIIRAALITVLVLGLSAAYFANADRVLTVAVNLINSMSAAVFAVMPTDEDIPIENSQQKGLVGFAGKAWDVLVVAPWAYGQFGTTSTNGLAISDDEHEELEKRFDGTSKSRLGSVQRIDQVILALPVGSKDRQVAVDVFQDDRYDHGGHPQTTWTLSPGRAMSVFILACTSLIASLIFAVFCGFMGALLLIADITIIFGLLVAPFVAVIALVPETGWSTAVRWAKIMLSALLAKVFYGIYVGMIFLVLSTVMRGDSFSFFFKMLLLCIVLIFALVLRKKYMDMVTGVAKLDKEQKAATSGTGQVLRQIIRLKQWKVIGQIAKNKGIPKTGTKPGGSWKTTSAGNNPGGTGNPGGTKDNPGSNSGNRRLTGNEIARDLKSRARSANPPKERVETVTTGNKSNKGQRYVVNRQGKNTAIYNLRKDQTNSTRKQGAHWIKEDIKGQRDSEGRPIMSNAVRDAMKDNSYKHRPVNYRKGNRHRPHIRKDTGRSNVRQGGGRQYSSGPGNSNPGNSINQSKTQPGQEIRKESQAKSNRSGTVNRADHSYVKIRRSIQPIRWKKKQTARRNEDG